MASASNDRPRQTDDNQWRWSAQRNPYLHNVFTFVGLTDPNVGVDEFNSRLMKWLRRARKDRAHEVCGYKPTRTDAATAHRIAANTNLFTQLRLLAHAAHKLDEGAFQEFIDLFADVDLGDAEAMLPLPLTDVSPIARRLPPAEAISVSVIQAPDVSTLMPLLRPEPADERVLPR